jgi:hypothetical protein
MSDGILYERSMAHGPAVRIRRTSEAGVSPVTAVLEVDRRAGTPRAGIGDLPPLMTFEGESESEVLEALGTHARDDRAIMQMLHEKGLR